MESRNSILKKTKEIALKHSVDLAIPNCEGSGLGNVIVYTRLVEEFSLKMGRPISIFTGPLTPSTGTAIDEDPFAIWRHNPFIKEIKNGKQIDKESLYIVNDERSTLIQLNHIIENICWSYGLKARELRSSLFLSTDEMKWALEELKKLPRPLVCLHPGGNSKSSQYSPWYKDNWLKIISRIKKIAGVFQVGNYKFGDTDLGLLNPGKKIREMMALIWASDFFIGFDSAPMHIATGFRKPVVTLFDMRQKFEKEKEYSILHVPSVLLRWSYPFNKNIAIMENDLKNSSLEVVINETERYLNNLYN
ncbi:glycosyltransferase family 9 protein [Akkermansia muciniphila]|uniref:glycosyltransferase family 9 protein n=1 Tax=Akkermansia muciniphila TaxID=239935 RepID=UPI000C9C4EB0|nr:glycosyltransferase family 9 protein [Akkermansia muciniphila]PNC06306.1 hypothetical protein CXU21_04510 [Akkermansia muciniphila]